MEAHHLVVGRRGEAVAAWFLGERGHRIVASNLRVDADEVDLVVERGGVTAAVEVKTSVNGDDPLEAVDDAKFGRFVRAVGGLDLQIDRIDLVGIAADERGITIRWLSGVR
jgi:putative endonuclease